MRRAVHSPGLAALALALAHGCGEALPSATTVDSLRLFALVTPTPDVAAGDPTPVTVDAVWVDGRRDGPARPVWFAWRLCPDNAPGDPLDPRDCPRSAAGVALPSGYGVDHVAVAASRLAAPGTYVLYLAMCPERPPVVDPALGHYRCAAPDGIESYREVVVRPAGEALNHNPGAAALDGLAPDTTAPYPARFVATLPGAAPATSPLGVSPAPGAAEVAPDGTRETLLLSVYADVGGFDAPRAVEVAPGATDPLTVQWTHGAAGPARVWLVLRDERGGETAWAGTVQLTR